MNINQGGTTNYLVPSSGKTHFVSYGGVFSATPYPIDWRQYSLNNFPFQPQGAFIDNTQGTGPLTINIQPIDFNVVVPAGVGAQVQFPAPEGQSMKITGTGQATVVFVDFPVLPNSGLVDIGNTVNIVIAGISAGVSLPVVPSVNSQGVPYQVQQIPAASFSTHTSGTTSGTVTPATPDLNLRKLTISITENAAQAAAGVNQLTVTLNGTQIFSEGVYIPAAGGGNAGLAYHRDLPFDSAQQYAAAGALVWSLASPLTAGQVDVNGYFA